MHLKDYYAILEVPLSATQPEIRKAYRRLAHKYHPDKNGDSFSSARFTEIKEAYEVLTNPSKKEYYLQQRWYNQSMGRKKTQPVLTPASLLQQTLELERYVSKLDVFRMDKYGLHDYIAALVDDSTIDKLNSFHEKDVNGQIVQLLLSSMKVLPLDLIIPLHRQLEKIELDPLMKEKSDLFLAQRRKANQRDRYRIWIILLTVIVLCLLIFFFAEQ